VKSKITLFVFGLFCQIVFSQTVAEKLIHGKIIVASGTVEGVAVINLVNEKSTVSDNNGDFYIFAKSEDLLVFFVQKSRLLPQDNRRRRSETNHFNHKNGFKNHRTRRSNCQ